MHNTFSGCFIIYSFNSNTYMIDLRPSYQLNYPGKRVTAREEHYDHGFSYKVLSGLFACMAYTLRHLYYRSAGSLGSICVIPLYTCRCGWVKVCASSSGTGISMFLGTLYTYYRELYS